MFRKCLVMLAALSAVASWGPAAQAAEKIGKVVAVVGAPLANGRKLSGGSDLFEDDRIVVKTGNAQILLDDNTRIVVGPNSTLLLDQFVRKDKGTASKVAIKALRGTYRFITGRSAKSAYKITTAQATIGIRGTGFDFWVKQKTGAAVMSGKVKLSGQRGGSTDLGANCGVGEATRSSSKPVGGRARVALIKENLPFILDQSSLRPRFRLNTRLCNINTGAESIGGGNFEVPEQREERVPNTDGNGTNTGGGGDGTNTDGSGNGTNTDGGGNLCTSSPCD